MEIEGKAKFHAEYDNIDRHEDQRKALEYVREAAVLAKDRKFKNT